MRPSDADAERVEPVDGIEEVNEDVEDEAVEDQRVEEADPGTLAEGAALRQRCNERVPDAARQMVET